jgi:hydrogenase maturation protease
MNLDLVEKIASAVLYEGYMLYPYRPSSVKNRQRFNFGALVPKAYSFAQGGTEACSMQTECLVRGKESSTLEVRIRFLHLVSREVGRFETPLPEYREDAPFEIVESLEVDGRLLQPWQEAVERETGAPGRSLGELASASPKRFEFGFPSKREIEPIGDASGQVVGILLRTQEFLSGIVEASAEPLSDGLFKITVRLSNRTPFADWGRKSRDEALMRSLVSTHAILGVRGGEFVSLLDPPAELREAAAGCRNVGTWPVLVGEEGERDLMLSSPIILYDYPQIAPESAGDLFDATEIDEILTLRILTLTEEEKREMRAGDARARQILERTEALPEEQMRKLHGAVRGLRRVKPLEKGQR